jgi:hypothetical protein
MAQHWLDLARYADTDGFEYDAARPQAWRYRDWVVAAFASDMPYDRFVQLQNAADQLVPGDASSLVATGFHRAYPDMVDLNDQGLRRQNALNDITETTAQVFLGLTLGCARCHDHKTDPLPQRDFYRLQAFFTPAQFVNDQPPLKSEVSDGSAPAASSVRGLSETTGPPPPTFVLLRGDYGRRGDAVTPGFPSVLAASGSGPILATADPPHRADLARWLTEPDHPLTARVIVNRQWQQSFGRGIVSTAGDFGLAGEPPSHPELLDWLATELVAQNWSLQAIQRLIVTSAVYRQSSTFRARGAELDPENTLLWRQNRRRLDGEALRDAILASSGRLTRAIGGPGVFPELPPELAGQVPKNLWPTSPSAADRKRRSLYTFVRRNLRYPLFEAFDRPDTNASCPTRASSTTAPQALSLLNSVLVQESAGALAGTIAALLPADRQAQVSLCFESILARQPDAPEAAACVRFLDAGGDLAALCVALYNTNPFIYLD